MLALNVDPRSRLGRRVPVPVRALTIAVQKPLKAPDLWLTEVDLDPKT